MKEIILKIRLATEEEIKKQYNEDKAKMMKKLQCKIFHISYGDKVYYGDAGVNLNTIINDIKKDNHEI